MGMTYATKRALSLGKRSREDMLSIDFSRPIYRTYDNEGEEYDLIESELIASLIVPTLELQEDTEDYIRKWIVSKPEVGDVLQESGHDLPIERIA